MKTLAEALSGQLQTTPSAPVAGGDQTQGLAKLMAAKSGKAAPVGGSTPSMSTLMESSAAGQTADTARQQATAGVAAGADIQAASAAQAATADSKMADVEQARLTTKQRYSEQAANLIQEFKQGLATLDLDKDRDKAEQLGFYTRLNSDQYVTELQQAGAEARLEDSLAFDEALMRDVWGEQRELLESKLKFADLLNMDENKFKSEMGAMDLDFALEMAGSAADAANTQAQYTAAGNMVSAGTDAYSKSEKGDFNSDYQTYKDDGGTDGYSSWQKKKNPDK